VGAGEGTTGSGFLGGRGGGNLEPGAVLDDDVATLGSTVFEEG